MKQGSIFASRIKKAFAKERGRAVDAEPPEPDEPVRRLCIGVLGARMGEDAARTAVDRLLKKMIDWNEVRVSHAIEIQEAMGGSESSMGDGCQRLREALQDLYQRENRVSLDRLSNLGRREARQYLESLKGVDGYAVASVVLWSLGGHAIPVDDRLLATLRSANLVHPEATRDEVQAFLERNISAADAKEFCRVMRKFSPAKAGVEKNKSARSSKSGKKSAK